MKDELRAQLDGIFDARDAVERRHAEVKAAAETKRQKNAREFMNLRESVIRKAMETCGQYLQQRGYGFEISTDDAKVDSRGVSSDASITLNFFKGRRTLELHKYPHLKVISKPDNGEVVFHMNTIGPVGGGQSGMCGTYPMSALNEELVQERFVHVIRAMSSLG